MSTTTADYAAPRQMALAARTILILEGAVLPTLLRLALPNIGEAAARVSFVALDAVFVGWLGTDALAGVSLAFPLFLIMQMTSASGLGAGV
jgi:Na+-driven multidrug efflux pump